MSFMELAKNRYSCRAFSAQTVEPEKLQQVLEAGPARDREGYQVPRKVGKNP